MNRLFVQNITVVSMLLLVTSLCHGSRTVKLTSDSLSVEIDTQFPRIVQYSHKNGHKFDGQKTPINTILLNGQKQNYQVRFCKDENHKASYQLHFPEKSIQITMQTTVNDSCVEMAMTAVKENGDTKLMKLEFPGNALLSLQTSSPESEIAAVAAAYSDERNQHKTAGTTHKTIFFEEISTLPKAKKRRVTANYFFLTDGKLATGLASNHYVDYKRIGFDVKKVQQQTLCRAWCPQWSYRQIESETVDLPFVRVFITPDCNGDGKTTWQDAAIAYRRNMPKPFGHEHLKNTVGANIAMNFASGAQQPFVKILDNIKKFHRATDGIGNEVVIKGFSAEGHDSANTDYSGNYNARAGGLNDFQLLLSKANSYNSRIGIHINVTEIYPESVRYSPNILFHDNNGNLRKRWIWLDQSYEIDKRKDILNGTLFSSLEQMKKDLPELDFVYIDKNHPAYWESMKIGQKVNELGLPIYVEGHFSFDTMSTWAHHRGKLSKIMLFLWFGERELFANQPILRGGRSDNDGFMGWQNRHNFNNSIFGTFSRNLPAKFLQHFELLRWEPGKSAQFSDGVKVEKKGRQVTVTRNGRKVMTWLDKGRQNRIFVSWDPKSQKKIYLWDETGGEETWKLPEKWQKLKNVYLYKLTDFGRVDEKIVKVSAGTITVKPEKNVPYVIYPQKAPNPIEYNWGEGSLVKDPSFNSHCLAHWQIDGGRSQDVRIENDHLGNSRLVVGGTRKQVISQNIDGLKAGKTYKAEVWVQIQGKRQVTFGILPSDCDSKAIVNHVSETKIKHGMPNDCRTGSFYQRLRVEFTMPDNCTTAKLSLKIGNGNGKVEFDDIRIAQSKRSVKAETHWFWEDFEDTALGGYGPFTCCFGERTHLSETNKPYTKDTINGRYSLKTRDRGRVLRTLPATLRFKPNTRYKLVCQTLISPGAGGRITGNSGGKEIFNAKMTAGRGEIEVEFATLDDSESFISLFKDKGDHIVIDDIAIDELGPSLGK